MLCYCATSKTTMPCVQAQNKKPKHSTLKALQDMTPEEQAKHEWLKEIRILQNMLTKDTNTFMQLKFKGQHLLGDKQSGVTKELLHAMETGFKNLQAQSESIHEVFVLGSSKDAKDFNSEEYSKKLETAKEVLSTLSELKARGQRIIGK